MYGSWNVLNRFFRFLIFIFILTGVLSKTMKKLSFFNTNFQNQFQDVYYRIMVSADLVILKWWSFEYKAKFLKKASYLDLEFVFLTHFFVRRKF